jgi:hypothetical protein
VGKIIRFGEWLNGDGFRNYEHAEIFVGGATKTAPYGYTFSAYPGGATIKPLPRPAAALEGALWSSGHIDLTAEQRASILAWCVKLRDTPYSGLDYFELAAHRLHLPVPGLKDAIQDSHHMICSQITDYIYMQAGKHLFDDGRWAGDVTPADLANLILKDVGIRL